MGRDQTELSGRGRGGVMQLTVRFKQLIISPLALLFLISDARPETVRICIGYQCPKAPLMVAFANFPCAFGARWKLGWLREVLRQTCPNDDVKDIPVFFIPPYLDHPYDFDNPQCSPRVVEAQCGHDYPLLSRRHWVYE